MNEEYLWIRAGERSDYTKEGSVEDLAELLAGELKVTEKLFRYGRYGVTDNDKFKGYNYISLFYGDDNAQPIKGITKEELADLNKRIQEWKKD